MIDEVGAYFLRLTAYIGYSVGYPIFVTLIH